MTQQETWKMHAIFGAVATLVFAAVGVVVASLMLAFGAGVADWSQLVADGAVIGAFEGAFAVFIWFLSRERRDHEIDARLKAVEWAHDWDIRNWKRDSQMDLLYPVVSSNIVLVLVIIATQGVL